MKQTLRTSFQALLWIMLPICAAGPALAQEPLSSYPSRPIRVVSGYPSGTGDMLVRMVNEHLQAKWGQPLVMENRPGASGHIATEAVAKSAPDGYTLLVVPPAFATTPHMFATLPFDPDAMVPITVMASLPNVLLVHPTKLPNVHTIPDLIAHTRANPGKLNYGSTGNGGSHHLSTELLMMLAGELRIIHVPYKGVAVMTGLLGGDVDMAFFTLAGAFPHIRGGKLRALAVGGERRNGALPAVPTLGEVMPGMVSASWAALIAPARTPTGLVARLNVAVVEALRSTESQKRLADLTIDTIANSPSEAAAFIREEKERWGKVIRTAGVRAD